MRLRAYPLGVAALSCVSRPDSGAAKNLRYARDFAYTGADPAADTGQLVSVYARYQRRGLGRQCIGRDFSIMEAQIILAMIVQRYMLTALPGTAALPKFSTTLKPDRPVMVKLERRAGS